ncbi:MAG: PAS domain S-box protein [Acidobacteria bacterium]|nr:PAS domain S-box protein [Acidobacteriota bacterium]
MVTNDDPVVSGRGRFDLFRSGPLVALVAFLIPFCVAVWGMRFAVESRQRAREARYQEYRSRLVNAITGRMLAYEELLRAAEAFIASSERVDRSEWLTFVSSIALEKRYPGLSGTGFIERVRRDELAEFLVQPDALYPGSVIHPAGDREEYYLVRFVEPLERNRASLGYDLRSSVPRRIALDTARNTIRPVITDKLDLVQHGAASGSGFLMVFPVFDREGRADPASDRIGELIGWVYIVGRFDDLMRNLPLDRSMPRFTVYDGEAAVDSQLLYASSRQPSSPVAISREQTIPVYGRPWTIRLEATAAQLQVSEDRRPGMVLALGTILSLMSAGVAWSLATTRRRAIALADSMTSELQASERRARSLVEDVNDGILTLRSDGTIEVANPAAERLFGVGVGALARRNLSEFVPGLSAGNVSLGAREAEIVRADTGTAFDAEISVSGIVTKGEVGRVVIIRDVTERKRAEREAHLIERLSLKFSRARSLEEAFTDALVELCEIARWSYGEVWVPQDGSGPIRCGAIWHREDPLLEAFARQRRALVLRADEGLAGWVKRSRSPLFVPDLEHDPAIMPTPRPGLVGFRSALAVPVLAEDEVVAVMTFFAPSPTGEIERCRRIIAATASQLGAVILRKRSEDALAESHNALQAVLNAATEVAIIATNLEGVVEVFNRGAERMLGYAASEVMGRSASDLMYRFEELPRREDDARRDDGPKPKGFELLVDKARRGVVEEKEWIYTRRDGERLTLTLAVSPLRSAQGAVVGFLGVAKDITLWNRTIEELGASESRVRSVIQNSLGGVMTMNRKGIVESLNPAAEAMFGYGERELVGRHFSVLIDEPEQGPLEIRDSKYASAIGAVTDLVGKRRNGDRFPLEIALFSFDEAAQTYYAAHMMDVSKRYEVDRMKHDFVSTVSHELRTPLTSIRGALGLVASGALGEVGTEAREMIGVAERNSVRLINLINDILDIERLESGRMEMDPKRTTMKSIIERSLENVATFADQEGIELDVRSAGGMLLADEDRIVQVLINYLSNAIKFSPRGATVTVISEQRDGWIECSVVDRGTGISEAAQQKLFQRFERVDASDSRRRGGTGLGLAISKAIVAHHGGLVGLRSEEGKGSTFWFRLPAVAERCAIDVVAIEDDEPLLKVIETLLRRDGVAIRAATSGRGGLSAIERQTPDLLVLDVDLPDGDGYEVVDELRRHERWRSMPLLVYTGADLTYDQRNRLRLGPTKFLMKSKVNHEDLREAVRELLRLPEIA